MKNKLESIFEGAFCKSDFDGLIVKYFEHAIDMKFESRVDLLYLAGGIALIGLALYLSHAGEHPSLLKKLAVQSESH